MKQRFGLKWLQRKKLKRVKLIWTQNMYRLELRLNLMTKCPGGLTKNNLVGLGRDKLGLVKLLN
jgi:hypothetical protein